MVMSLVKGSEIPASNTKHGNFTKLVQDQKNRQQKILNQINAKVEEVTGQIVQEYLERKPHYSTIGGFTKFPTVEGVRQQQLQNLG